MAAVAIGFAGLAGALELTAAGERDGHAGAAGPASRVRDRDDPALGGNFLNDDVERVGGVGAEEGGDERERGEHGRHASRRAALEARMVRYALHRVVK
jgi:hypothetical protein